MKVDEVLLSIYNEVLSEIEKEKGIKLSVEEIHNVFVSQLEGFTCGVLKDEPIHWINIGKFLPLNRKANSREAEAFKKNLEKELEYNTNIDSKAITSIYAAEKAIEKESLVKKLRNDKPIGLKSLIDKPNKGKYNKFKLTLLNKKLQ